MSNASINTTGFQFVKDGISLNFHADIDNQAIILKGKQGGLSLSVSEAYQLKQLIENMISLVNPVEAPQEPDLTIPSYNWERPEE